MKTWIAIAAVVAGLTLTAVVAGGAHHRGMHAHAGPGEGLDWFVNGALDDLNATAEQRTKVLAVKDRMAGQLQKLHGEHAVVHAAFLRAWDADKMDSPELHRLVDATVEELRGALHGVVDGVAEIHDTLTPEQRRLLTARVQEHGRR